MDETFLRGRGFLHDRRVIQFYDRDIEYIIFVHILLIHNLLQYIPPWCSRLRTRGHRGQFSPVGPFAINDQVFTLTGSETVSRIPQKPCDPYAYIWENVSLWKSLFEVLRPFRGVRSARTAGKMWEIFFPSGLPVKTRASASEPELALADRSKTRPSHAGLI